MTGPKFTAPCLMDPEGIGADVCLCGWDADDHTPTLRGVHEAFANLDRLERAYERRFGHAFHLPNLPPLGGGR